MEPMPFIIAAGVFAACIAGWLGACVFHNGVVVPFSKALRRWALKGAELGSPVSPVWNSLFQTRLAAYLVLAFPFILIGVAALGYQNGRSRADASDVAYKGAAGMTVIACYRMSGAEIAANEGACRKALSGLSA